jgi:hypothetical protein
MIVVGEHVEHDVLLPSRSGRRGDGALVEGADGVNE